MKQKKQAIAIPSNNRIFSLRCTRYLTAGGFDVSRFVDVHELSEKTPVLIIVDSLKDAQTLATEIQLDFDKTPVLAAISNERDCREAFFSLGIVDYISLPLIARELLYRVDTALSREPRSSTIQINPDASALVESQRAARGEQALVRKTCSYLYQHFDDKLHLDDIAISVGSNRSTLAAAFKQIMGQSVFEWLRAQRMLKAKTMLLNSDKPIQQIAFEVGYEYSANFSNTYKRQFNISPREQRKHLFVGTGVYG